jgi:hypothetical protein
LLLLCANLHAAGVSIDPGLVDALANAPQELMTQHPYLVRFSKAGRDLFFVSGSHESGKDSETCVLIRRALARFPIKRVIVEGRPRADGVVSKRSVESLERESSKDAYRWGETDCAILTAWKKGVRSVGGEPTDAEQYAAVQAAGLGADDYLADYFIKMIPSYRAQGRVGSEPIEGLFEETGRWARNGSGIGLNFKFAYGDFLAWHHDKLGAEFDPAKVDYAMLKPNAKGTVLQRVAQACDESRNRTLALTINGELARHKAVLVVYGNGHHAALRRALVAAFGEPVYSGDLSEADGAKNR